MRGQIQSSKPLEFHLDSLKKPNTNSEVFLDDDQLGFDTPAQQGYPISRRNQKQSAMQQGMKMRGDAESPMISMLNFTPKPPAPSLLLSKDFDLSKTPVQLHTSNWNENNRSPWSQIKYSPCDTVIQQAMESTTCNCKSQEQIASCRQCSSFNNGAPSSLNQAKITAMISHNEIDKIDLESEIPPQLSKVPEKQSVVKFKVQLERVYEVENWKQYNRKEEDEKVVEQNNRKKKQSCTGCSIF